MVSTIYDGGQPFGNPCGLQKLSFIELTASQPLDLALALHRLGLACKGYTYNRSKLWYGTETFAILIHQGSLSSSQPQHPTRISAMGWQVSHTDRALQEAIKRGARPALQADLDLPAVDGVDNSVIYLADGNTLDRFFQTTFIEYPEPHNQPLTPILALEQINQQVPHGHLQDWVKFYQTSFSFHRPNLGGVTLLPDCLKSATIVSPDGQITLCLTEQDRAAGDSSRSGDSITLLATNLEQAFPGLEEESHWPSEILIQPVKPVHTDHSLSA